MPTLRSLADLGAVFAYTVPIIADDFEIGHLVVHGDASQASAYNCAGRPLGTFSSRAEAEAVVRGTSFQEAER
ncbi:hypothetical protein ABIE49_001108 [Bradyrhizobium sp. OAE829]